MAADCVQDTILKALPPVWETLTHLRSAPRTGALLARPQKMFIGSLETRRRHEERHTGVEGDGARDPPGARAAGQPGHCGEEDRGVARASAVGDLIRDRRRNASGGASE